MVSLKPGDSANLEIRASTAPAQVLAVIEDRALVEYQGPKGWTALRFASARCSREDRVITRPHYRAKYTHLGKRWYLELSEKR